ncbi:uncharacterized protein LOC142358669 isoform X2 [Convolutriloba macropyga]|uniref:uncharacterized protein LOC142358669 isoform X2 n=1 Tax=Convolutriloba macropyga TaxID=536237 RepID=UPI003F522E3B
MLFVISPQFLFHNGAQFTLSLLSACGKYALEEEPSQKLWVALVGSENEEILQLNAYVVSILKSMLDKLTPTQAKDVNVEDRMSRICSAVLSFRDFSADVVNVFDSPQSCDPSDVKEYFDSLHFSLRPNVAHLSDIQFLLNSGFDKFVGCFGEDGFGVRTTDVLIGDLVEAGSLSLSEFVNGLVIRSFAQQVENLEIGISSETSSNTENLVNKFSISMLHKRNAAGKRKRSQSPIGISGSFGPDDNEFGVPTSSDFDHSTASEPVSMGGIPEWKESHTKSKRRKKDRDYCGNARVKPSKTRAAKLLMLSQSSSVNDDDGILDSNSQKDKIVESSTSGGVSSETAMKLIGDVEMREPFSSQTSVEFGNGCFEEREAEKLKGAGYREFFHNCYDGQKFYSRDERCEVLNFDNRNDLFKFIDKQLQLLPDEISLIGLTQLQHAVFQLIAYHWKHAKSAAQWLILEDFAEFISNSMHLRSVEKMIVVCFELQRYTNSCGVSNVTAIQIFMTTLQKEIGKKITLEEFQTKLRKFVKQAFTEWYFPRSAKFQALAFIKKLFSFDAENQYLTELTAIIIEQYAAIADQAEQNSDSEVSDDDLDVSINDLKGDSSVANCSSCEDVFNSSVSLKDDSRRDSNSSAVLLSNSINRIKNRFSTRSSSSVRLMLEQNAKKGGKRISPERNGQNLVDNATLMSYSQRDTTKLVAKLDKSLHVKESVKLQSKMLQRSLSQSFRLSNQSSVDDAKRSKLSSKLPSADKTYSTLNSVSGAKSSRIGIRDTSKMVARKSPAQSILKSAQKLSWVSGTKEKENCVRFSAQPSKGQPRLSSKTPVKESLRKTRHDPKTRSSNRLKGKKLLTKKVLETPGAKLKSRLLGKADYNEERQQLKNTQLSSSGKLSVSKIKETPFNKMPKNVAPEEVKHRNRIRRSITATGDGQANLCEASTKPRRTNSFYKSNKQVESTTNKVVANTSYSTIATAGSQTAVGGRTNSLAILNSVNNLSETVFESVDLGTCKISPYSLFFKPNEHGKVNELILTPAKHFDEVFCESVGSASSGTGETPLRGIFPIKNSNGKRMQAIHAVGTLSLVDSTNAKELQSDKENDPPPSNGHLTRSTTKIHQFRNVKLTSASKIQKPAANVRKSLFSQRNSKSQHSPKKFAAKSSFHDDKPATVYKIFCEDSLSMDYLTELVNEKSAQDQSNCRTTLFSTEERNCAYGSGSTSDFDFKLKKRLPIFDSDNSPMRNSLSPSPLCSKSFNTAPSVLSNNERPTFLAAAQKNEIATSTRKCGNLSRALDELLKNPFVSPRITGASPA